MDIIKVGLDEVKNGYSVIQPGLTLEKLLEKLYRRKFTAAWVVIVLKYGNNTMVNKRTDN